MVLEVWHNGDWLSWLQLAEAIPPLEVLVSIAPKGTYINIPKGVKHSFLNQTNEEVKVLFLTSPAGYEGLLDELVENEQIANHPEGTSGALNKIGKKYGLIVFEE